MYNYNIYNYIIYHNIDIAVHWSYFIAPFQEDSDQCLANYTIFNEDHIDDSASKGVICSKRDSIQLLMEHGHMRLMELLLTVLTILEKFVVREDQDQLPYIHNMDVVDHHLIKMATFTCCIEGKLY